MTNLRELVKEEGRPTGKNSWVVKCPCPEHNDQNPSLALSLKKGRFLVHCFAGCEYHNILDAWGITEEDLVVKKVKEIEYIYNDKNGDKLYSKTRFFPKSFVISPSGAQQTLYNLNLLYANPEAPVVLTEGEKDSDSLTSLGVLATTAGGSENWKKEYSKILEGRRVYIVPDNDDAGIKFANQAAEDLLEYCAVFIVRLPLSSKGADVTDYLQEASIDDFKKILSNTAPYRPKRLLTLSQIAHMVEKPIRKIATGVKTTGMPTGYKKLDKVTGGMAPGTLWILAARPSVGKTALALNIVQNNPDIVSAVFSMEMNDIDIIQRMLSFHTGFELPKLRGGITSEKDLHKLGKAMEKVKKYSCVIDDTPNLSPKQMWDRVEGINDLGLIIVDYLQIMKTQGDDRNNALGKVVKELREMAKTFHVPVLALSQLNRQVEYRNPPRPQLSDLRDSGNIEQDADVVIFPYRQRDDDGIYKNRTQLIVAKNRQGACINVDLLFDYRRMYFDESAVI